MLEVSSSVLAKVAVAELQVGTHLEETGRRGVVATVVGTSTTDLVDDNFVRDRMTQLFKLTDGEFNRSKLVVKIERKIRNK